MSYLYLGLAISVLVCALYSGLETGIYCINKIRLRHRLGSGDRTAGLLSRVLSEPADLVTISIIGTNLGAYGATLFCTALFTRVTERYAEFLATLVLAPLLLIVADAIPKSLFQHNANMLMYRMAWFTRLSELIFWPAVRAMKLLTNAWRWLLGARRAPHQMPVTVERLRHFFSAGAEAGVLSLEQTRMARNIMGLERISLRSVMVPLGQVAMIPENAGKEQFLEVASANRHSRLPVYRGTRETVSGVLVLLDWLCSDGKEDWQAFVRPATSLPARTPIDAALLKLQKEKQPMGIVVDESSRAVGIVTMKDLVEEIVGELAAW